MNSYIGRFAPTPSGPLHFGSIIAALGSYLDARSCHGKWLIRIDDFDTPRVRKGAIDSILTTLEQLGLFWDSDVVYQSSRIDTYQHICNSLLDSGLVYRCYCPRKTVKGMRYPGTCSNKTAQPGKSYSLRVRTDNKKLLCRDRVQGDLYCSPDEESGDFIIRRTDGLTAYHLATVIDDAWQGITHVVRGADLLHSSISQIYLQKILGYPIPDYCHLPVAADATGKKISKSDNALHIMPGISPARVLIEVLQFLGHNPPAELLYYPVQDIIQWGTVNWQPVKIPNHMLIRTGL